MEELPQAFFTCQISTKNKEDPIGSISVAIWRTSWQMSEFRSLGPSFFRNLKHKWRKVKQYLLCGKISDRVVAKVVWRSRGEGAVTGTFKNFLVIYRKWLMSIMVIVRFVLRKIVWRLLCHMWSNQKKPAKYNENSWFRDLLVVRI